MDAFCKGASRLTKPLLKEGDANLINDQPFSGTTGNNINNEPGKHPQPYQIRRRCAVSLGALAIAGCAKQQNDQTGALARTDAARQPTGLRCQCWASCSLKPNSSELAPQGRETLDKQGACVNRYNRYAFTIERHADERGTREYNIALGALLGPRPFANILSRAVSWRRMHTISYGKERPVAVCDDISCWSQNRRAVSVLDQTS